MSILIEGMSLQKGEDILINYDGGIYVYSGPSWEESLVTNRTAINLPPHGRLIDADALMQELWKIRVNCQMLSNTQLADAMIHGLYLAQHAVQQASTVIEAEEAEEV